MTVANYLYALVYSGVYDPNMWQSWGENLIKDAEYNDDTEWVFNIIFSNSKKEFYEKTAERRNEENYMYYNEKTLTEIIQGYYYIQYQEGTIGLYKMLEYAGQVADAGQDSMDCEFFYDFLNQIDGNPDLIEQKEFREKIIGYFEPLSRIALAQKQMVENCTVEDLKNDADFK